MGGFVFCLDLRVGKVTSGESKDDDGDDGGDASPLSRLSILAFSSASFFSILSKYGARSLLAAAAQPLAANKNPSTFSFLASFLGGVFVFLAFSLGCFRFLLLLVVAVAVVEGIAAGWSLSSGLVLLSL